MRSFISGARDQKLVREASLETGITFLPSKFKAQQHFKQEADINVIVERCLRSGMIPQAIPPMFNDQFIDTFDFKSANQALIDASRSFMMLDPKVRKRFGNDPHEFVQFCSNPENLDEMRRMGLAIPAPIPENPNPPTPEAKKE